MFNYTFDTDSLTGIEIWDNAQFGVDTTVSATEDGTGSLKLSSSSGDAAGNLTTFVHFKATVTEGKSYKISFDFRVDNAANNGADAWVKFYPTSGTDADDLAAFGWMPWDCATTGAWNHKEATVTPTASGEYTLHFKLYGLGGTIYLDNVSITEVVAE